MNRRNLLWLLSFLPFFRFTNKSDGEEIKTVVKSTKPLSPPFIVLSNTELNPIPLSSSHFVVHNYIDLPNGAYVYERIECKNGKMTKTTTNHFVRNNSIC